MLDDLEIIITPILVLCALLIVGSCSIWTWPTTNNLEYIKTNAPQRWKSAGFVISGYDGYTFGSGTGSYGGAQVWYYLKKNPDNGIIYSGYLQRWGDEIHTYRLEAVDAIKPTNH